MSNRFEQFRQNAAKAANRFAEFVSPSEPAGPSVIATTKDGGQVFRMGDGSLSFKSPGYATTNQDAIARIMEGATPIQEAQRTTDELTIAQNPVAARVQEFNQGAPLVGEWLDEAVGVVAPRAAQAMRQTSEAMERQNPIESAGLNVAGGIAYTVPAIIAGAGTRAADYVTRGTNALGRALRGGQVAAAGGAIEGASSFAGRAREGERGDAAGTGAAVGATLGAVLGTLAPMVGEGAASLAKRVKRLDVSAIADEFGLSAPAARVVKSYLANDDLDAAARILARGGDDAMLANAGPSTRQALDTAMSTGGEALSVARTRIDDATTAAGQRFKATLDDVLGPGGGVRAAAREISQGTSAARQSAYTRAYTRPVDYASDAGRKIEGVLSRIPPKTLKSAVDEANEAMQAAGLRNMQVMAEIGDDGSVVFREMPNVQQLDEIKKALGNIGAGEVDNFGRPTARGIRANRLAAELRDAVSEAVPEYRTALKLGGDKIAQDRGLELGRGLLSARTTVEDVRDVMRGASADVKAAAKRGLRENIDAVMGRARSTLADMESGAFDFDTGQNAAKEALDAMRSLTTPDNMRKVRMVLGADGKRLFDEMQKTADALVLRAAVARNSATAIRQAGQQQMADEVAPGTVRRVAGNMGNPLEAARDVTQTIVGIDPRSMSETQRAYFAEIANALTRIRGEEAQRALAAVRRAMAGQPLKDEQARLIGRVVAGSSAAGGYQAGSQFPERRLQGPR